MTKTVLVTGASRGIGRAIAIRLAEERHNIVLNAVKNEALALEVRDIIEKMGCKCIVEMADVSDYNQCLNMFKSIESHFGGVDILINNAGVSHIGLFSDMTPNDWKNIININFGSVLNCTHIAMAYMLRQKYGIVLNISSMWGELGASCEAIYSASKGALNSFTKSMAKEMGLSGIRFNAIACGVIETDMNKCFSECEKKELAEQSALMRIGSSEEVAEVAAFLCSDNSSFITGQIINVDGGRL